MSKRLEMVLLTLVLLAVVVGCAKKGSITGGEKDETPPVFVKAFPPNFSTNFNKKEIRIYFDEYVKLKDAQKQIIISPPMDPKPTITPLGSASKYVKIKFEDTLLQNTTYSINFGESIQDNNEGNAYPFFKYVFSTGDFLDSLSLKGNVINSLQKKIDPYITVELYELNEEYKDSLVFKEVPRYVTNTLDSTFFEFNNLKEGKFKLIALKDASSNYLYDPKQDRIGFLEDTISLPADTAKVINVEIFKEVPAFKAFLPKQVSKNKFLFPYEGTLDSMSVALLSQTPENFQTRVIPDLEKDTLNYWFKPFFEQDSLIFEVTNTKNYRDTLIPRFKDQFKDSLVITAKYRSSLPLNKNFLFSANTPIDSINKKHIILTDKDTLAVPFSIALDTIKNEAELTFEKQNVESYPVIAEVTNDKNEVISEKIVLNEEVITFDYLNPGNYYIRIILDANKNQKWDTGNFLKGIQPEIIKYFPDIIDVRANWELKQTFILE